MIYIKQLNRLFVSHRMEVPNRFNYVTPYDEADWYRDVEAYKIWRASETKVVGNPKWVDGQEVIEGVDYRIEKKHTYWNEVRAKNVTVPAYAIPITPKPDDVATERLNEAADLYDFVPGGREEDSLASDKATSTVPCVTLLYDNNTTQKY